MSEDSRITGDWPSPNLLERYPNWEYALDEEDADGSDETTLCPSEDQSVIGEYVPFSAAISWLNNGIECPSIIEFAEGVAGISLNIDGQWYRILRIVDRFEQFERWEPYVEEWLPINEQSPSLSLSDQDVFPLRIASRLPYYATLSPIRMTILPDGGEATSD